MKKTEKMPTARACDVFSILAAAVGICAALVYFIPRSINIQSVVLGLLIIFGFFVVAVIVRILGIIGQNLFDLNAKIKSLEDTLKHNKDDLRGSINDFRKDANGNASRIESVLDQVNCGMRDSRGNASHMESILDQVNCDTRDINEGIRQIKVFFEQIERHLNLKK
jgi:methyl-accepting chemotaxis protein